MRGIVILMMRIINALNTNQRLGFSLLVLGLMSSVLAMEDIEQNLDKEGIYKRFMGVCFVFIYVVSCDFKFTSDFELLLISWLGLHEEMKLDMQRIWKRNLGRDDRCMADNGKEVLLTSLPNIIFFSPQLLSCIDYIHFLRLGSLS